MDDAFTKHKATEKAIWQLIVVYQKQLCENFRLNRKSGPEVDAWREIGFTLQDSFEELNALNKSFKDFDPTLEAIHKVELDLACFRQINEVKIEANKATELAINAFRSMSSTMCELKK